MRGINREVRAGEVFAFLGPNAAGKTTTVEMLEVGLYAGTSRAATGGEARVAAVTRTAFGT